MRSGKQDLENSRGEILTNSGTDETSNFEGQSKQSRREFIKYIGTLIFGLTLVDRTARQVFAWPPCNSPGDQDNNCNSPGDNDAGCGNGNKDEGCSSTEPDENCHTKGPGGGKGDKDESCGHVAGLDEGCGDCNDKHDTDDNCGQLANGGIDPDEMCGHVHTVPPMDTDDNCKNAGDNDQGCGTHDGPGTPETTDEDEGCSPGPPHNSPDKNCSNEDSDDNCVPSSEDMPNTTTPDENCTQSGGNYDEDNACSQWFDIDEACRHSDTDQDQGCGGKDTSAWPIIVSDEDQNCGNTIGEGGPTDQDDRCSLPRTFPLPDWGDNT